MTTNDNATNEPVEDDFDSMTDDVYDDIEKQKTEKVDPEHVRLLEAALFASHAPVKERSLSRRLPDGASLKPLLKALKESYEGRGVNLVRRGGMWAFRTATDLGPLLNVKVDVGRKLSRAAIETLSIIAYHQPVTRGEIEEIRGVSLSRGTLDILFDEGWIKPRGRRNVPGHPMQWGTTDEFLDHFALASVKDLPGLQELRSMGLLDARPSIEAYSVSGELGAKSEDGGDVEITESIIIRAEEDYPESSEIGDSGGETGIMSSDDIPSDESVAIAKEAKAGESAKTASALDEAMGAVAEAVKSAAKAIEREQEDPDEDDEQG